jgi:SAM-dependent methyltransferase
MIDVHLQILREKPMMREVFHEFYDLCIGKSRQYFSAEGPEIEIGAGISLFKHYYPHITVTDIRPSPHVEAVLDAQAMQLGDASVRAFYGISCFHHLPEPRKFFRELLRVLKPQGGCVLIDPCDSLLSRAFYPRLHKTEGWDRSQEQWENAADQRGPMQGANQALSYIVFQRDRRVFEREFPGLEIVEARPMSSYVRYLFSGGLNFRQLLPSFTAPAIRAIEPALIPLSGLLALYQVIVLRKR